jgi:hypothetical protein
VEKLHGNFDGEVCKTASIYIFIYAVVVFVGIESAVSSCLLGKRVNIHVCQELVFSRLFDVSSIFVFVKCEYMFTNNTQIYFSSSPAIGRDNLTLFRYFVFNV